MPVSNYLQLSNHSGVLVTIFIFATLQFEGVAEISEPFEFWDILQFTVIHLRTHSSHVQLRRDASAQLATLTYNNATRELIQQSVGRICQLTLRVSYPFLR